MQILLDGPKADGSWDVKINAPGPVSMGNLAMILMSISVPILGKIVQESAKPIEVVPGHALRVLGK